MSSDQLNRDQFVPAEFGTTPIPEGHIRFNHYTAPEHVEAITSQGLRRSAAEESFARGGTEYPAIFATVGRPSEDLLRSRPVIEGHYDPTQLDTGKLYQNTPEERQRMERYGSVITFHGDVPPSNILAVHEPWHQHYRYLASDPRNLKETLAGIHDTLAEDPDYPEYGKAISFAKARHAGEFPAEEIQQVRREYYGPKDPRSEQPPP